MLSLHQLTLDFSYKGLHANHYTVLYDLIALVVGSTAFMAALIIRFTFRRRVTIGGTAINRQLSSRQNKKPRAGLTPPSNALRARLVRSNRLISLSIVVVGVTVWSVHHIITTVATVRGMYYGQFKYAYLFMFALLAIQLTLAYSERPKQGDGTDNHVVAILVPAYNESPELLEQTLWSMFRSSRLPDAISVVDDGSTQADYTQTRAWFLAQAHSIGDRAYWQRTKNQGKRHAQMAALQMVPEASIVVTVDSDAQLDPQAIAEGLKPFSDPQVQSVAGVVLASNNQVNLLSRFTDNLFVTAQLTDRSAMSSVGQVLVNSGGLAFYRSEIFWDNQQHYLTETFGGVPVAFSDDSLACLYALSRGKTVQQPSAFVFTAMPQRLKHHRNQQMRWLRGSFIRSWWRLRYLPLLSWGFARQALGWVQLLLSTYVFSVLLVVNPLLCKPVHWEIIIVPVVIGYINALRYWSFRRSDMTVRAQLLNYLLTPAATFWAFAVLRPFRFWAILTCCKTGWNTRQQVEIGAATQRNISDETPFAPPDRPVTAWPTNIQASSRSKDVL